MVLRIIHDAGLGLVSCERIGCVVSWCVVCRVYGINIIVLSVCGGCVCSDGVEYILWDSLVVVGGWWWII